MTSDAVSVLRDEVKKKLGLRLEQSMRSHREIEIEAKRKQMLLEDEIAALKLENTALQNCLSVHLDLREGRSRTEKAEAEAGAAGPAGTMPMGKRVERPGGGGGASPSEAGPRRDRKGWAPTRVERVPIEKRAGADRRPGARDRTKHAFTKILPPKNKAPVEPTPTVLPQAPSPPAAGPRSGLPSPAAPAWAGGEQGEGPLQERQAHWRSHELPAPVEELVKLEHYVEKNCAGAKLEPGWSVSRFRRKNGTYEGRWDLYL